MYLCIEQKILILLIKMYLTIKKSIQGVTKCIVMPHSSLLDL